MKNNTYVRVKNLFDPAAKTPFKLSRSKLEDFLRCPRCFYLDRRLGIGQPSIPAFTLNTAVDELLKKEFDIYRREKKPHPLMERFGVDAVPFSHPQLKEWRENFKGVQHHHKETNLVISGAIDDLWQGKDGKIFVVDYKSTSTRAPIDMNSGYKLAYKRQMEIYQWLLRHQGLQVASTGYFVYCNASKDREKFDSALIFDLEIIAHQGDDSWVDEVVGQAKQCLMAERVPDYSKECEYCQYTKAASLASGGKPKPATVGDEQKEFLF